MLRTELARGAGESWTSFIAGICGSFAIGLIHLHNISGCRSGIMAALAELDVPFGYTIHDLNFACPTITLLREGTLFCGGETAVDACSRCLERQPEYEHLDIAGWRERHDALVRKAAFRIAPSQWAATMAQRYFPDAPVDVVPHGVAAEPAGGTPGTRSVLLLPPDDLPTIAIMGAIGPDKGARRLERLVALARERRASLRFVLIGYMDFQHGPWQSDDALFTVHGHYATRDLPDLFDHYRVALVAYPSAGPETFSFTLTEAWRQGRPVLVPPIGALAERVAGSDAGWVMSEEEWRDESRMLERLIDVVRDRDALARASSRARSMRGASIDDMARRTLVHYERAVASRRAAPMPPLEKGRLLYGLGYRPWHAPYSAQRKSATLMGRVKRAAARRLKRVP
jgi:glycosyltransferase involved in cell wall biosynthesis